MKQSASRLWREDNPYAPETEHKTPALLNRAHLTDITQIGLIFRSIDLSQQTIERTSLQRAENSKPEYHNAFEVHQLHVRAMNNVLLLRKVLLSQTRHYPMVSYLARIVFLIRMFACNVTLQLKHPQKLFVAMRAKKL